MAQRSCKLKEHHEATPHGQTLHGAIFDPRDLVASEIHAFILDCAREGRIVSQMIAPIDRYEGVLLGTQGVVASVLVTVVTE